MANLAQVVNVLQAVILTKEEKMLLTPTYHVMEMYNVHQDATLLPIKVKTNTFEFEGEKLPAVSVSASKDAKGLTHISLTNVDPKNPQEITIDLKGAKYVSVAGRILTAEKLRDYNSFENPNKIQPKAFSGATISGNQLKVKLPAFSVAVLELK
jgi:alpha-N-arabinofuranosidase